MVDSAPQDGRVSNTPAAILLGSVLGLFFSGIIIAGVCSWQLWAAAVAEGKAADAASVTGSGTVPPPVLSPGSGGSYGVPSPYGSTATSPSVSPYDSTDDVQYYAPAVEYAVEPKTKE